MANEQLAWPSECIDLNAATQWGVSACGCAVGAPEVLQVKRWGVTARFGNAVLKASFTPMFPQATQISPHREACSAVPPDSATPVLTSHIERRVRNEAPGC